MSKSWRHKAVHLCTGAPTQGIGPSWLSGSFVVSASSELAHTVPMYLNRNKWICNNARGMIPPCLPLPALQTNVIMNIIVFLAQKGVQDSQWLSCYAFSPTDATTRSTRLYKSMHKWNPKIVQPWHFSFQLAMFQKLGFFEPIRAVRPQRQMETVASETKWDWPSLHTWHYQMEEDTLWCSNHSLSQTSAVAWIQNISFLNSSIYRYWPWREAVMEQLFGNLPNPYQPRYNVTKWSVAWRMSHHKLTVRLSKFLSRSLV